MLASGHVLAQGYPAKPIRLLAPFAPGGSTDVTARILGAPVGQALGQNIVIDNRPGSGGMIATQETARANADGYTLLHASGAQMGISPALGEGSEGRWCKNRVAVLPLREKLLPQ